MYLYGKEPRMRKYFAALIAMVAFATLATGCVDEVATDNSVAGQAQQEARKNQDKLHKQVNNVEFSNYNDRLKLADDPATILWCTFFPPTVGQEPITVPIAGKLTSSAKRPYRSTQYVDAGNYSWYAEERAGPDAMFGSSSEYRYGFDPTRAIYTDFTDLASICTTAPTVYQRNKTHVMIETDPTLNSLTKAAEAALKAGDAKAALKILQGAETKGK